MSQSIVNVFTVDLEDYYMVSAFESVVKREGWHNHESRIDRNTHKVLEILSQARPRLMDGEERNMEPTSHHPVPGVRATFFCIGWIAQRNPHLIKEIERQGHEIACHSFDHQLVYNMTPDQFREDIRTTKRILEDITGKEVCGYRAPSYSITERSLWALRILAEEGYRYDSSIFPIHHDRYGIPTAPRFPFVVNCNGNHADYAFIPAEYENQAYRVVERKRTRDPYILEYPISTVKWMGHNVPVSGGGYMRLYPYSVVKRGLKKINAEEKRPFVVYIHPWELDPDQPRMDNLSFVSRFRHYINLENTAAKLNKLLDEFAFSSMGSVIGLRQ